MSEPGLSQALHSWAQKENCPEIVLDQSDAFARVWLACFVYGVSIVAVTTGCVTWCSHSDAEDAAADDAGIFLATTAEEVGLGTTTSDKLGRRSFWSTTIDELSEIGGTGVELYFRLLRGLGACYICMFAITSPIVAFSWLGDFAPSNSVRWPGASVGNLGMLAPAVLQQSERFVIVGCQGAPLSSLTPYFGWLDALSASAFLAYVAVFYIVRVPLHARQDILEAVTSADFAVEIDCLPRNLGNDHDKYEDLLREYLVRQIAQEDEEEEKEEKHARLQAEVASPRGASEDAPSPRHPPQDLQWIEFNDTAFSQSSVFQKGVMTEQQAREVVERNRSVCIGYSFHQNHPEYRWIVKRGSTKISRQPGWTCNVFKVKLKAASETSLFEDDFAGTSTALGSKDPGNGWSRPGRDEGLGDAVRLDLMHSVNPNDLRQGALGDCWLISSFAALAEFPKLITSILKPNILADDGKYEVRLFDYSKGRVVPVIVDDRLPNGVNECPAFAGFSEDGEIWPCILEKAVAKLAGSYDRLEGADPLFGLGMLTGTPCEQLIEFRAVHSGKNSTWICLKPEYKSSNPHDPQNKMLQSTWPDSLDGRDPMKARDWGCLLQSLAKYDQQKFLMACGSHSGSDRDCNEFGIVQGHAYTILRVELNVANSGRDMVQLRNPWGRGEWKGDWSDGSKLWERYPDVKAALRFHAAEDGLFWMQAKDFFSNFSSVMVCCIGVGSNRAKYAQHFQSKGPALSPICDLSLVRDFRGQLRHWKVVEQLRDMVVIRDLVARRREMLHQRLHEQKEACKSLPVLRAYVVVNRTQDARKLIRRHHFAEFWVARIFKARTPLFRDTAVRIRRAPEPSNIMWENQDVCFIENCCTRAFMMLVALIITAVSFFFVLWLHRNASEGSQRVQQVLADDRCNSFFEEGASDVELCDVVRASSWSLEFVTANGTDEAISCFCASRGYQAVIGNELLRSTCEEWLFSTGEAFALSMMSSCTAVFINVVLKAVLGFLVEFERPATRSKMSTGKMKRIFVAQTFNMGFVIFLVNYRGLMFFSGPHPDFARDWYVSVGSSLCTSMLLNSFMPLVLGVWQRFQPCLWRCVFGWCSRDSSSEGSARSGPVFDVSACFGQLLTTVYCTSAFSSGLPLLNLFAAIYMGVAYWVGKADLLDASRHASQRPPLYDDQIASEACQFMLCSVALHCMIGIGMYSQPCTFPSAPSAILGGLRSLPLPGWLGRIFYRCSLQSTWMLFLILVSFVALCALRVCAWVMGHTLGSILKPLCAYISPPAKVVPVVDDKADALTWGQAEKLVKRAAIPASYKLEEHPEFTFMKAGGDPGQKPTEAEPPATTTTTTRSAEADDEPRSRYSEEAVAQQCCAASAEDGKAQSDEHEVQQALSETDERQANAEDTAPEGDQTRVVVPAVEPGSWLCWPKKKGKVGSTTAQANPQDGKASTSSNGGDAPNVPPSHAAVDADPAPALAQELASAGGAGTNLQAAAPAPEAHQQLVRADDVQASDAESTGQSGPDPGEANSQNRLGLESKDEAIHGMAITASAANDAQVGVSTPSESPQGLASAETGKQGELTIPTHSTAQKGDAPCAEENHLEPNLDSKDHEAQPDQEGEQRLAEAKEANPAKESLVSVPVVTPSGCFCWQGRASVGRGQATKNQSSDPSTSSNNAADGAGGVASKPIANTSTELPTGCEVQDDCESQGDRGACGEGSRTPLKDAAAIEDEPKEEANAVGCNQSEPQANESTPLASTDSLALAQGNPASPEEASAPQGSEAPTEEGRGDLNGTKNAEIEDEKRPLIQANSGDAVDPGRVAVPAVQPWGCFCLPKTKPNVSKDSMAATSKSNDDPHKEVLNDSGPPEPVGAVTEARDVEGHSSQPVDHVAEDSGAGVGLSDLPSNGDDKVTSTPAEESQPQAHEGAPNKLVSKTGDASEEVIVDAEAAPAPAKQEKESPDPLGSNSVQQPQSVDLE